MTYREEQKRQIENRKNMVIEFEESEAIAEFFRRNLKTVLSCQANEKRIRDYFNGDPITLEALQQAFDGHPAFKSSLALQTEDGSRDRLEKEIRDLLENGASPNAVNEQIKSIRFKTTEELADWRDRLTATKTARSKSVVELREEIRTATQSPEPDLPESIGADQIKYWDPEMIRYWIKKLGSVDPINKRLNRKRSA